MQRHHIGNFELGIDGYDAYYRVQLDEDDLLVLEQQALTPEEFVLSQLPRIPDSDTPGLLFTSRIDIVRMPHSTAQLVVVVCVRRDV